MSSCTRYKKKEKKKKAGPTMLRKGNRTKAAYNEQMARGTSTVRFSRVTSLTERCTSSTGGCKKIQTML